MKITLASSYRLQFGNTPQVKNQISPDFGNILLLSLYLSPPSPFLMTAPEFLIREKTSCIYWLKSAVSPREILWIRLEFSISEIQSTWDLRGLPLGRSALTVIVTESCCQGNHGIFHDFCMWVNEDTGTNPKEFILGCAFVSKLAQSLFWTHICPLGQFSWLSALTGINKQLTPF